MACIDTLRRCGTKPAHQKERSTAIGDFRMTGSDDVQRTMLRNKLLGKWAAKKLGLRGQDAEAYSDALMMDTVDPKRSDVFSKIRKDFDAAGVTQSDEQILHVMTELMVKAGDLTPGKQGASEDAAVVALARNLMSQ
jgi:hypothetical protein